MFSLLNPLYFYVMGAVGVMVPLMLHLIQSRQTVKVPFSTVRFLKLAQEKSSVQIKLENILLWIIRTALLVSLALAFAMPLLKTDGQIGKWWGKSPHDVAIVIDASYSMEYNLGRATVWDKTVDAAVSIIEGLGEQDKFVIFVARDYVEPVIEQLSGETEEGIAKIKALKTSQTSSQLAPAIMDAYGALEEAEQPNRDREVHVLTDMQALPWKEFEKKKDEAEAEAKSPAERVKAQREARKEKKKEKKKDKKKGDDDEDVENPASGVWDPKKIDQKRTKFFITLLGVETPENLSPVSVEIEPPLILADAPATAKVRIMHTGPPKASTVTMELNGKEIGTRSVSIGAGGVPEARFAIPSLSAGWHKVLIRLPDDNLMIDNTFHLVLHAEDQFPTLCVGTRDKTVFLRTALKATSGGGSVEAEWIEASEINSDKLSKYSCVFLCDALPLSGEAVTALASFVDNGGLLAVFPGDNATPADYKSLSMLPAFPTTINYVPLKQRKKVLHWDSVNNPLLENLETGDATISVIIKRGLSMDVLEPRAENLIVHGDTAFLTGRPVGRGYAMLFEVAADRSWSDFPLSPFYLPIVHQVVGFAAGVGANAPYVWCTDNLSLSRYLPEATVDTKISSPDGKDMKIRTATYGNETSLYVENLMKAGVYTFTEPGEVEPKPGLAVNMVRNESSLDTIPQDTIVDLLNVEYVKIARDQEELARLIKESRIGRTFGEQLLWLVLILAAAEFFLANMLSTESKSLIDTLGIDISGKLPDVSLNIGGDGGGGGKSGGGE